MKKGMLVLCLGVASLSLSSCSIATDCDIVSDDVVTPATWNDVIDFTTGIFTNLQLKPWCGAYYELSSESIYNDGTSSEFNEYYFMDEVEGGLVASGEKSRINKDESSSQGTTCSYYVADSFIYIEQIEKVTGDDSNSEFSYSTSSDYAEGNTTYTYSKVMREFEDLIEDCIFKYTMTGSSYYTNYGEYAIGATKSNYSISWTLAFSTTEFCTFTIKTDNYFVNYLSVEYYGETRNSLYDEIFIIKECNQNISKPSWVNDTNFPPEEEENN